MIGTTPPPFTVRTRPERHERSRNGPLFVALAFIAGGLWASCGAAQVAEYQTADELCELLEQRIEDRERTTLAEDEQDLRTIRRACDEAFDRIETQGGESQ